MNPIEHPTKNMEPHSRKRHVDRKTFNQIYKWLFMWTGLIIPLLATIWQTKGKPLRKFCSENNKVPLIKWNLNSNHLPAQDVKTKPQEITAGSISLSSHLSASNSELSQPQRASPYFAASSHPVPSGCLHPKCWSQLGTVPGKTVAMVNVAG